MKLKKRLFGLSRWVAFPLKVLIIVILIVPCYVHTNNLALAKPTEFTIKAKENSQMIGGNRIPWKQRFKRATADPLEGQQEQQEGIIITPPSWPSLILTDQSPSPLQLQQSPVVNNNNINNANLYYPFHNYYAHPGMPVFQNGIYPQIPLYSMYQQPQVLYQQQQEQQSVHLTPETPVTTYDPANPSSQVSFHPINQLVLSNVTIPNFQHPGNYPLPLQPINQQTVMVNGGNPVSLNSENNGFSLLNSQNQVSLNLPKSQIISEKFNLENKTNIKNNNNKTSIPRRRRKRPNKNGDVTAIIPLIDSNPMVNPSWPAISPVHEFENRPLNSFENSPLNSYEISPLNSFENNPLEGHVVNNNVGGKKRRRRLTPRKRLNPQYFGPSAILHSKAESPELVSSIEPLDPFGTFGFESYDGGKKFWQAPSPAVVVPEFEKSGTEQLQQEKHQQQQQEDQSEVKYQNEFAIPTVQPADGKTGPTDKIVIYERGSTAKVSPSQRPSINEGNQQQEEEQQEQQQQIPRRRKKKPVQAAPPPPPADLLSSESVNPFSNSPIPISNDLQSSHHHNLDLLHSLFNSDTILKDAAKIPENKTVELKHKLSDTPVSVKIVADLHDDDYAKNKHFLNHDAIISSDYERQLYKNQPIIRVEQSVSMSMSTTVSSSSSSNQQQHQLLQQKRPGGSHQQHISGGSVRILSTTTPMPNVLKGKLPTSWSPNLSSASPTILRRVPSFNNSAQKEVITASTDKSITGLNAKTIDVSTGKTIDVSTGKTITASSGKTINVSSGKTITPSIDTPITSSTDKGIAASTAKPIIASTDKSITRHQPSRPNVPTRSPTLLSIIDAVVTTRHPFYIAKKPEATTTTTAIPTTAVKFPTMRLTTTRFSTTKRPTTLRVPTTFNTTFKLSTLRTPIITTGANAFTTSFSTNAKPSATTAELTITEIPVATTKSQSGTSKSPVFMPKYPEFTRSPGFKARFPITVATRPVATTERPVITTVSTLADATTLAPELKTTTEVMTVTTYKPTFPAMMLWPAVTTMRTPTSDDFPTESEIQTGRKTKPIVTSDLGTTAPPWSKSPATTSHTSGQSSKMQFILRPKTTAQSTVVPQLQSSVSNRDTTLSSFKMGNTMPVNFSPALPEATTATHSETINTFLDNIDEHSGKFVQITTPLTTLPDVTTFKPGVYNMEAIKENFPSMVNGSDAAITTQLPTTPFQASNQDDLLLEQLLSMLNGDVATTTAEPPPSPTTYKPKDIMTRPTGTRRRRPTTTTTTTAKPTTTTPKPTTTTSKTTTTTLKPTTTTRRTTTKAPTTTPTTIKPTVNSPTPPPADPQADLLSFFNFFAPQQTTPVSNQQQLTNPAQSAAPNDLFNLLNLFQQPITPAAPPSTTTAPTTTTTLSPADEILKLLTSPNQTNSTSSAEDILKLFDSPKPGNQASPSSAEDILKLFEVPKPENSKPVTSAPAANDFLGLLAAAGQGNPAPNPGNVVSPQPSNSASSADEILKLLSAPNAENLATPKPANSASSADEILKLLSAPQPGSSDSSADDILKLLSAPQPAAANPAAAPSPAPGANDLFGLLASSTKPTAGATTPGNTSPGLNDILGLLTAANAGSPAGAGNDLLGLLNLFQQPSTTTTSTTSTTPATGSNDLLTFLNLFTQPTTTTAASTSTPAATPAPAAANDLLSLLSLFGGANAGAQTNSNNQPRPAQAPTPALNQNELDALVQQALLESLGIKSTNNLFGAHAGHAHQQPVKSATEPAKSENVPAKNSNEPAKSVNNPQNGGNYPAKSSNNPAKSETSMDLESLLAFIDQQQSGSATTAAPAPKTVPTKENSGNSGTAKPEAPVYTPASASSNPAQVVSNEDLILQILTAEANRTSTKASSEVKKPVAAKPAAVATTNAANSASNSLDLLTQLLNSQAVQGNLNNNQQIQQTQQNQQISQQNQQILQQNQQTQQNQQLQQNLLQLLGLPQQQQQQQSKPQPQQQPALDIQSILAQSWLANQKAATSPKPPEVAPAGSSIFNVLANQQQFAPKPPPRPSGLYYWVDLNAFMGDNPANPTAGLRPKLGTKDYFLKVKRQASSEVNTEVTPEVPDATTNSLYLIY